MQPQPAFIADAAGGQNRRAARLRLVALRLEGAARVMRWRPRRHGTQPTHRSTPHTNLRISACQTVGITRLGRDAQWRVTSRR